MTNDQPNSDAPGEGVTYRLIPLTRGFFAKVDPEDYDFLMQWKWYASKKREGVYYAKRTQHGKNRKCISMHRVIMNVGEEEIVDHKDNEPLNNQKINLRIATKAQNNTNKKSAIGSSSKYMGVSWAKSKSKWHVLLRKNNVNYHLGYFENETDAAKRYDAAAPWFHGEFANLNFK